MEKGYKRNYIDTLLSLVNPKVTHELKASPQIPPSPSVTFLPVPLFGVWIQLLQCH